MPLINCEIELILTWSRNSVIISTDILNQIPTFTITETTQDIAKLLPQLKNGSKRTINWNKYLIKLELLAQNANLNNLIEPSFQGLNRLFILAFEDDAQRISRKRDYIPNVEIKNYNAMIDGKNFFDQPINNMFKICENIRKIATGQGMTIQLVVY